ncbi:hypothetical protein C8Q80DRAFT_1120889 [Daedaleopsis nitida]|nr:hypothetical protein C8Q80DRAFT_1120889 [Daedaleopsis nitida]
MPVATTRLPSHLLECKRRKIKCDRANPCGPCVRRGEQAKCQWHIIEPMEKYVTRAEFDELRSRVHDLEAILAQTGMRPGPSSATMASSSSAPIARRSSMSAAVNVMPMTSGPPPEVIQGTAITPYQAYGAALPPPPIPCTRTQPRPGPPYGEASCPICRPTPAHRTLARLAAPQRPTARLPISPAAAVAAAA